MKNRKPLLKAKVELWDTYQNYLHSWPWFVRWAWKRLGYFQKTPLGCYDPFNRVAVVFVEDMLDQIYDAAKNAGIPMHEEPTGLTMSFRVNFTTTLIHELIHASGVETSQGSHKLDPKKVASLSPAVRVLFTGS